MEVEKIVLRLDLGVDFEREFVSLYKATPRSRRQEWFRAVLMAGLGRGAPVTTAGAAEPVRAAAPAAYELPRVSPVVANRGATSKGKVSAASLKGFLETK